MWEVHLDATPEWTVKSIRLAIFLSLLGHFYCNSGQNVGIISIIFIKHIANSSYVNSYISPEAFATE